jgi:uncharacterized protein
MQNPSPPARFPQLLVGLVSLSVALVISSVVGAGAIRNLKRVDDALLVTGSAKRPIRSDYVIWRASVSSQQSTAKAAYQDLQVRAERLQRYLETQQIPDQEITLSPIETTDVPELSPNGRETGRTLAYRLTQRLEIRSKDVDRITKVSQQITELINEGIPITSERPEYLYTQLSQVRIEMMAEATKDAKARAEAIAKSTNSRVGDVQSAETGVFQITSRYSTAVSDAGLYDTSSIEKDITAVVSVKFGMK